MFKVKNKNFVFKHEIDSIGKNLSVISVSVLKNLRTYLYLIIFPMLFLTGLVYYKTMAGMNTISIAQISGLMHISCFMIMLLVNITISEWKNSVFLKRIHSAGVSKTNFLVSMFIFGILVGIFSFLISFVYIFILSSYVFINPSSGSFWYEMTTKVNLLGWFGIFIGAFFSLIISIGIGTLISGIFKSVALSQTIITIILIFTLIFSDVFLSVETLGKSSLLTSISFILPYKHSVWTSYLLIAQGNKDFIYTVNTGRVVLCYNLDSWKPIICSISYSIVIIASAFYLFKWSSK